MAHAGLPLLTQSGHSRSRQVLLGGALIGDRSRSCAKAQLYLERCDFTRLDGDCLRCPCEFACRFWQRSELDQIGDRPPNMTAPTAFGGRSRAPDP